MVSESEQRIEQDIIDRLKQGERSCLDVLVDRYRNKGFAIAYGIVGNHEDAKDVLQEAFIKVYFKIRSFNEKASFYTWFYRIVTNCAFDCLRKRKAMYKIFAGSITNEAGEDKDIPDERYEAGNVLSSLELSGAIDSCIAKLPPKQKACFTLKHQQGLSNIEISKVLNCSLSTVKVHLFRAVRNLQKKFYPC